MTITILGSGCPNCQALENNAKKAVEALGREDVHIEHEYDAGKIPEYGVMSTPAIVIGNEVKAAGRIPEAEEIQGWLA